MGKNSYLCIFWLKLQYMVYILVFFNFYFKKNLYLIYIYFTYHPILSNKTIYIKGYENKVNITM